MFASKRCHNSNWSVKNLTHLIGWHNCKADWQFLANMATALTNQSFNFIYQSHYTCKLTALVRTFLLFIPFQPTLFWAEILGMNFNRRGPLIKDKTKVLSVQLGKTLSFVNFVVEWGGLGWRGVKLWIVVN